MVHTNFSITILSWVEPFHVEKYGVQYGHSVNNINDESLYNNC